MEWNTMAVVLERKMRKLIVVVAVSVVGFAIFHFSYTDDFAFSEHLSGSIQILDECSPNALERTDNPRPVVGSAIKHCPSNMENNRRPRIFYRNHSVSRVMGGYA